MLNSVINYLYILSLILKKILEVGIFSYFADDNMQVQKV